MIQGLITKVYSDIYKIKTENGYIECNARGIFKKNKISLLVGDRVIINEQGVIDKILPRKNEFIRPPIANIDQMIIVVATTSPNPDLMLLDKQLIMANKNNVEAIICINKIDLNSDYEEIVNLYENLGYQIFTTDAKNGIGIDKLALILHNKITSFVGNSGVGKSALTNNIFEENISEEGELSKKAEKGKHTTKYVELYEITDNTYIADTPGFSTYEIQGITHKELDEYFIEFSRYIEDCEFRGCSHIKERNCGVKKAVEKKKINIGRYERYCTLYKKLEEEKKW